jgi:hypothetical protein
MPREVGRGYDWDPPSKPPCTNVADLEARFESFKLENTNQMAGVQTSLQQILGALEIIKESTISQHPNLDPTKPQLKIGYIDKNGMTVSTPKGFLFLKSDLTFFITPDLPFRLPPCDPRPGFLDHENLRSMPVGMIFDSVAPTDELHGHKEQIGWVVFEAPKEMTDPEMSFFSGKNETVEKQDIHLWYDDEGLQDLGRKCLIKYFSALDEDERLYEKWVRNRRHWEWDVFCLARQHYAKINWSEGARYDKIMATEESSSLLNLPRFDLTATEEDDDARLAEKGTDTEHNWEMGW